MAQTQTVETNVQEDTPELAEARAMGKELERMILNLRAYQPDEVLHLLTESKLPGGLRHMITGWAWHQKGDYVRAARAFEQVDPEELKKDAYFSNRLEELQKTAEALKDFTVFETENFSFRYMDGIDKVMLYFLPDILEQVYASYSSLFHFARDEKIIVELMPDYTLFSYASALSKSQIETTGTIALCVENRLVVLTPRRVAQGYYWPDVIAHEFVHYILTKKSGDKVPLWMQEGVAKFFEARWEDAGASPLDAGMETSLALALKQGELLSVKQMMPSFAALPSAQMARQAYAQTTTMIDYLCRLKGEQIVPQIVVGLRDGDMDQVLTQMVGVDFKTFEADWRDWLIKQNYKVRGDIEAHGVTLLDKDILPEKIESLEAENQRDLKHVRLGDLLLERNRYVSALKEYGKINQAGGKMSRQIVLRVVDCNRKLGREDQVIKVIDENISEVENDITMLVYKAQARAALEENAEVEILLQRAIRLNPFHPAIYRLLVNLETGSEARVHKYREILDLLTQPGPGVSKDRKT